MMKIIHTKRSREGGGPITRFGLELPWFCVWHDMSALELQLLRGQTEEICDMLVSIMGRTISDAYQDVLVAAIHEGVEKVDEQPASTY